jgi:hypothetical protein
VSDLFLRSVKLKDFRTFGEFEADVVPAPGLTLLVGTNGLGKSSFFDALEWGLTGEVRRFKSYLPKDDDGKHLTRRGAAARSHAVTLGFNTEGGEITRGAKTLLPPSSIIALLKKPEWTADIQDISTYLAFTHFLGQAAQQRFTSRARNEQWESLKGPSGIDRLDEVRAGLRGRSTELAFNRRERRETELIAQAEQALADWRELMRRATRLREASDTAGGLDTGAFAARLAALEAALQARSPTFTSEPDVGPAAQLIAIRLELERVRRDAATRRALLETLADIPAQYAAETAVADPDSGAMIEARATLARETDALGAAAAASSTAAELLESLVLEVANGEAEIGGLEALRSDLEAIARADADLAKFEAERLNLVAGLSAKSEERGVLEREIGAITERAAEITRLTTTAQSATVLANAARNLPVARQRMAASAAALTALGEAEVRTRLTNAIDDRIRLEGEVERARSAAAVARERSTAIAAAVAAIASHLQDHDKDCPVCRTHFMAGQLQLVAREAAQGQDSALAAAEQSHADLSRQLEAVTLRVREAEAELRNIDEARTLAEADAATVAQVEATLSSGLPAESVDLTATALAQETQAVNALSAANAAALGDPESLAEKTSRRDVLVTNITSLEAQVNALVGQIISAEGQRRSALERVAAAGRSDTNADTVTSELSDARDRLATAVARRTSAEQELQRVSGVEAATRSQHQVAQAALQRLTAAQAPAVETIAALASRWTDAGLPGVPTIKALQDALQTLGDLAREVERQEDERSLLAAAVEVASKGRDLAELAVQMDTTGGDGAAKDPAGFEAVLVSRLEEARVALSLTQSAHKAVDAFADKLRDEATKFSTQFLTPLNGLIDDFNEALLSTPVETVRLNAAYLKDRTQFDMGLHYRDPLDDALFDTAIPPQVVLSEGQLAANGFSILCAASTAYPWSRWRALLMDDPLQHNDIIHAAAFVDLMRNLVELQGYQLIMSSHDRAEAEFIRRKFDAANLPCSVLSLTAPSKAGVRYLPPDHNSAARKVLAAELAHSA